MQVDELLAALWQDYVVSTPQAAKIHALLEARGERVVNDHVALRTFDAVPMAVLAAPFEALGWRAKDRYRFDDKHLDACYWQHADPALPKVFISELVTRELSAGARSAIGELVEQLPAGFAPLPWEGRPWHVWHATYEALLVESEYAAWLAAFGFRVNHFTIDVNALTTFAGLAELDAFLVANGFVLNHAGGTIKGTPADRLEQSSTRAEIVEVAFADRKARIPSCYYEFAKRYPLPDGTLFQGFVPRSADKIFESTDVRRSR
jgi:hypothetical protein